MTSKRIQKTKINEVKTGKDNYYLSISDQKRRRQRVDANQYRSKKEFDNIKSQDIQDVTIKVQN